MEQHRIRVGLVEDSSYTRIFLRSVIAIMPQFRLTLEAATAADLLDGLHRADDLPQILLLDISLPDMDGYELMRMLARRYPYIRVLVLSMHRERFAVTQMISLGARGFLEKDRMEELERALCRIRDGGPYFSAGIDPDWIEAGGSRTRPVSISPQEKKALRYCAGGLTFSQIADLLGVCEKTAHEYNSKLYRKLEVHNASAMVRVAIASGLIRMGDYIPSWEEEIARRKKSGGNGTGS